MNGMDGLTAMARSISGRHRSQRSINASALLVSGGFLVGMVMARRSLATASTVSGLKERFGLPSGSALEIRAKGIEGDLGGR
jgi:hypothetical protein